MDLNTKKLFQLLLTIMLVQTLSACSEEEEGSGSGSSGGTTSPVDSTPVGTVETTGFWVNVKSSLFPSFTNTSAGWGNPCFIDADTTPQRMDCMVDILEGDLYVYGMSIQYNAPPDLCTHVTVEPAWHWNFSAGKGPKAIVLSLNSQQNVTACQSTMEDDSIVACAANPEVYISDNRPVCIYNHSIDSTEPNCCFGTYDLTVETDTDDDTFPDEFVTSVESWNTPDGVRSCLGGSIVDSSNWDAYSRAGYPVSEIYGVGLPGGENKGLNQELVLSSNADSLTSFFSYQANYFTEAGNLHTHSGYVSAATSDLPYAIAPIDDLDGSLFDTYSRGVNLRSGSPSYRFACLDGAFEVLHEIHVYIREWNTLAAFMAYEESEGVAYDPDVTGDEGAQCDYDPVFGTTCNDQFDLDDIVNSVGGSYDTTDPTDFLLRSAFFPRISK